MLWPILFAFFGWALALSALLTLLLQRNRLSQLQNELNQNQQLLVEERSKSAESAKREQLTREEMIHLQAKLEQQEARAIEQVASQGKWIELVQSQMQSSFSQLSQQVLGHAQQNFLTLAESRFKHLQSEQTNSLEEKRTQVEGLLEPIRKSLQLLEQERNKEQQQWNQAYGSLHELLKRQADATALLHHETHALTQSLKATHVRGVWGEIQLKRIVELAGMTDYCDFDTQVTLHSQTDNLKEVRHRPDLIVRLPGNRQLAVDAKAPLKAYLESMEESSSEVQKLKLKEHAAQLKQHVLELSQKEYWTKLEGLDLVILFIPGDSFLHCALSEFPDLMEWAASRRVLLATPASLIALLKSCAYSWHHSRLEGQLAHILSSGKELYARLCRLSGHIDELRKGLEKSLKSYNELVGSWQSRVLTSARKLQELDPSHTEMEPLHSIDGLPRVVILDQADLSESVSCPL